MNVRRSATSGRAANAHDAMGVPSASQKGRRKVSASEDNSDEKVANRKPDGNGFKQGRCRHPLDLLFNYAARCVQITDKRDQWSDGVARGDEQNESTRHIIFICRDKRLKQMAVVILTYSLLLSRRILRFPLSALFLH